MPTFGGLYAAGAKPPWPEQPKVAATETNKTARWRMSVRSDLLAGDRGARVRDMGSFGWEAAAQCSMGHSAEHWSKTRSPARADRFDQAGRRSHKDYLLSKLMPALHCDGGGRSPRGRACLL